MSRYVGYSGSSELFEMCVVMVCPSTKKPSCAQIRMSVYSYKVPGRMASCRLSAYIRRISHKTKPSSRRSRPGAQPLVETDFPPSPYRSPEVQQIPIFGHWMPYPLRRSSIARDTPVRHYAGTWTIAAAMTMALRRTQCPRGRGCTTLQHD